MKYLKIISLMLVTIAVIVVITIGGLGYGSIKTGEAIVEEVNQPVIQNLQNKNGKVEITVPLREKRGLKYEGIEICTPSEHENEMFFESVIVPDGLLASHSCTNGTCSVQIEVDNTNHIPRSIEIYIVDSGVCKKVDFLTDGHMATLRHEATIEFTDELLQALNIADSEYKVKTQESIGVSSWQIMGTKKVNLSYGSKVSTDNLKVDGVVKAKIIFNKSLI